MFITKDQTEAKVIKYSMLRNQDFILKKEHLKRLEHTAFDSKPTVQNLAAPLARVTTFPHITLNCKVCVLHLLGGLSCWKNIGSARVHTDISPTHVL